MSSVRDIDVPAFDFRVLDARDASHAFVKRFVAGRAPFIRWTVPVRVDADSARWMLDCCAAVVALPRADVCTLHAYTTQAVFDAVQGLLRHPGDPDTYVTGLVQADDQAAHALWGCDTLALSPPAALLASALSLPFRMHVGGAHYYTTTILLLYY